MMVISALMRRRDGVLSWQRLWTRTTARTSEPPCGVFFSEGGSLLEGETYVTLFFIYQKEELSVIKGPVHQNSEGKKTIQIHVDVVVEP